MSRFDFSSTESEPCFSFHQDSEHNTGGSDNFPNRLKRHNQWLITHDKPWEEDQHKKPKHPTKGWNDDSTTLLSFEEAYDRYKSGDDVGIAFRFTDGGDYIGFDFDKVKVNGDFTNEVQDLVQRLNSYTEVSSSGTGLHVIAEGERTNGYKNRSQLSTCGEIEVYDTDRYFILTGEVYDGFGSVESHPQVAQNIQEKYLSVDNRSTTVGEQEPVSYPDRQTDVTPEQVRQTIQAYVKTDSREVDREVLRLWQGNNVGRKSTSEADMAFVKQLFYWCQGDQLLMDECFRASGRMRSKWDEERGDQTYGEMTIQKVCQTNSDMFKGRYVNRD